MVAAAGCTAGRPIVVAAGSTACVEAAKLGAAAGVLPATGRRAGKAVGPADAMGAKADNKAANAVPAAGRDTALAAADVVGKDWTGLVMLAK